MWFIDFIQHHQGLPVLHSSIGFTVKGNKIIAIGDDYYPDISISTVPQISESTATNIANGQLPDTLNPFVSEIGLCIVPSVPDGPLYYRLSWRAKVYALEEFRGVEVLLDAQTGEIIQKHDLFRHGSWSIDGYIKGKIHPEHTWDSKVTDLFKHAMVEVKGDHSHGSWTNSEGYYYQSGEDQISTLTFRSYLAGKYATLYKEWFNLWPPFGHRGKFAPHEHNFPNGGHTSYNYTWDGTDQEEEGINVY